MSFSTNTPQVKSKYIVTRFLFVFVRQSGCTANTETAAFVAEAEKAMAAGTH